MFIYALNCSLKMIFLELLGEITPKIFPFVSCVVDEVFMEKPLFQATCSALKTSYLRLGYRNHPSILFIGEACHKVTKFSLFLFTSRERADILKLVQNLDINNANQESDIFSRVIKENSDMFGDFLLSSFIDTIKTPIFRQLPNRLYNMCLKKEERYSKSNYRPVSILPHVSKVIE